MNKVSMLRSLTRNRHKWKERRVVSISSKSRRIVLLCLVLLIAICLSAIVSLRAQSTEVDYLVLTVAPVTDINIEILREMTAARVDILEYQVSNEPKQLDSYRAIKIYIEQQLEKLHNYAMDLAQNTTHQVDPRLIDLEAIQRDAAERWLSFASKIERGSTAGDSTVSSTEFSLFEGFRRANSELAEVLESERELARTTARTASDTGTIFIVVSALATLIVMLGLGLHLAKTISKPIVDLSDTLNRQRSGDKDARANENQGSRETRNLAQTFNELADHETELRRIQSRALQMHELISTIARGIGIAPITEESLTILCATLGNGLGVDFVVVNTFGSDDEASPGAQWHQSPQSSLGSHAGINNAQVKALAKDLWQTNDFLVSDDGLAPETHSVPVQHFYKTINHRAFVFVPIGSGDRVIGFIYLVMVDRPRHWEESEVGAVGRVAEILARFLMEDTLRVLQLRNVERLEQLNIQKENFVATVSHELRTPLTSIIGYLEVLKDGYAGELSGEQLRLIEILDRNATRLLGLITNLLTLTRIESTGTTEDVDQVSISELIRESCDELPPIAQSAGIKLEIDAGPKLALVRGNRGQLKSVIVNIISNAIKFSRPAGVVTVRCTIVELTRRIRIIVVDRGIGIPAADQKELFTRFFRGSNATAKYIPGTGLGLSIVKQIVSDHGGEVQLTSVEGEGTTVTIDLPMAPTEVDNGTK